jgi:hypothetical protein
MKKLLIAGTLLFALLTTGWAQQNDLEQIKTVINKAYIEGIHNNGDLNETRKGFHHGFDLLMLQNNQLVKLPIYNWIESTERARKENPDAKRPQTTVNYVNVDITGTAAVAKIELLREGKLIFTDYLMLYRFDDGWKIVGKTYFRHP